MDLDLRTLAAAKRPVAFAILALTIGSASFVLANLAVWQATQKVEWLLGAKRWIYFSAGNALVVGIVTCLYFAWHSLTSLTLGEILSKWLIATILLWICVMAVFTIWKRAAPKDAPEASLVFSIFWGLAAGIAVLIDLFHAYSDEKQKAHAFLCSVLGAAVGWVLGLYLTPQDPSERAEFAKIGTAVAAGASGYTLKTFQDWGNTHHQYAALILFGITALMLSAATVYNTRAYGNHLLRISTDDQHKIANGELSLAGGSSLTFKAAVIGEEDTSVQWSLIIDSPFSSVGDLKGATLTLNQGAPARQKVRVKAESVSNPKLVDFVDVIVA